MFGDLQYCVNVICNVPWIKKKDPEFGSLFEILNSKSIFFEEHHYILRKMYDLMTSTTRFVSIATVRITSFSGVDEPLRSHTTKQCPWSESLPNRLQNHWDRFFKDYTINQHV